MLENIGHPPFILFLFLFADPLLIDVRARVGEAIGDTGNGCDYGGQSSAVVTGVEKSKCRRKWWIWVEVSGGSRGCRHVSDQANCGVDEAKAVRAVATPLSHRLPS
jgi:hypothetical protein